MSGREILDVHVTQWNNDHWTGGPYSTLGVGARPADRASLSRLVHERLAFAGEHVSEAYPGTMHGALITGAEAALKLSVAFSPARAIVIGAGLAGLMAAQVLQEHGSVVTVLEATDRVGGRARTDTIWKVPGSKEKGVTIQPGAAWIHGPDGNPIADLALQLGIEVIDDEERVEVAFRGGAQLDEVTVADVLRSYQRVMDLLSEQSAASRERGDGDSPIGPRLHEALATIDDSLVRDAVAIRCAHHFESLMAGRLDDLSFHYGDEEFAFPGGDWFVAGPLQPLVDALAGMLPIHRRRPAEHIRVYDDRVEVTCGGEHGGVVTGDVCVVCVPIGPLQSGAIVFEPPLPSSFVNSLDMLRMGDKAKVFLRFDRRWWGEARFVWRYPAEPRHSYTPGENNPWSLFIDVTEQAGGVPVLCAFVGGREARRLQDLAATGDAGLDAVRAEAQHVLDTFVIDARA